VGKIREISDKVSDFTDKYGIANPIEVADAALGGQTREESKARREKIKEGLPYKGTYNSDKKRGEVLKDNMSTGEYYKERKGIFFDTSGEEQAKERASELNAKSKKMAKGGKVSSASKRADGCAVKGKTRGKMC
jgi:hypothetical protein